MNKGDVNFRIFNPKEEGKKDFWYFLNYGIYRFQGKATHVGICIDVLADAYVMAESQAKGFVISSWDKDDFDYKVTTGKWEVKPSGIDTTNLKELAESMVGTPYGYLDYVKFITYLTTGKKLFKGSSRRMVCSESIAKLLYLGGNDIRTQTEKMFEFDYISPQMIYDRL